MSGDATCVVSVCFALGRKHVFAHTFLKYEVKDSNSTSKQAFDNTDEAICYHDPCSAHPSDIAVAI